MSPNSSRSTPSREVCETTITRILRTEVLEHGRNTHFKTAADFMKFFQSLYPASDALTKQVQRAIKVMDMPKDEQGYFIVDKTGKQVAQEQELRQVFSKYQIQPDSLDDCETIFLKAVPECQDYLMGLLMNSITFGNRIVTIQKTCNGLILYTRDRSRLLHLLSTVVVLPE